MLTRFTIIAFFAGWAFLAAPTTAAVALECDWLATAPPNAKVVPPSPEHGYNYSFVLYVPRTALRRAFPYLIVEPINPGAKLVDAPEQQLQDEAVTEATESALGHQLADRLGAPLLVPIFPRPRDLYTHSLSFETMRVPSGPLRRIDLQLIAMTRDAKARLTRCGLKLSRKIMIDGYSASGMFASRFVFLHPGRVAAAAFGGVSGFLTLPVARLRGRRLNYPLGAFDYAKFAGQPFDKAAFNAVPQFAFMGGKDTNDCVGMSDCYSEDDSSFIHGLGASMVPDRWKYVQGVYRRSGSCVQFATYNDKDHDDWVWKDERVTNQIKEFFEAAARKGRAFCPRARNTALGATARSFAEMSAR